MWTECTAQLITAIIFIAGSQHYCYFFVLQRKCSHNTNLTKETGCALHRAKRLSCYKFLCGLLHLHIYIWKYFQNLEYVKPGKSKCKRNLKLFPERSSGIFTNHFIVLTRMTFLFNWQNLQQTVKIQLQQEDFDNTLLTVKQTFSELRCKNTLIQALNVYWCVCSS